MKDLTHEERLLMAQATPYINMLMHILEKLNRLWTNQQEEAVTGYGNDRPAVRLAEDISRKLLRAANTNDMCGCPLCRS